MGKFNYYFTFALLMLGISFIHSCFRVDDNNRLPYPSALVTVKPNADNSSFYLQLNEDTILNPVNMKSSPFGAKEVRALVNYREASQEEIASSARDTVTGHVYVNWLDSIRTKAMAPHLGEDEDNEAYGTDPVEIIGDWLTVVEDGYLTLHFRTRWGNGTTHFVNLVSGADPEDPCYLVFHHDAQGDLDGQFGDALVAFKLSELPAADTLTLAWQSYDGIKTTKLECGPRTKENNDEELKTEDLVKALK